MAPKTKPKPKPKTVDEYLAGLTKEQRAALQRLRKIIRAAVPKVQESLSYGLVGFKLDGKGIVWIGAAAKHCALYGVRAEGDELDAYDTSGRGTLRFALDDPLPATLVRKLVKARMARVPVSASTHRGKRPPKSPRGRRARGRRRWR